MEIKEPPPPVNNGEPKKKTEDQLAQDRTNQDKIPPDSPRFKEVYKKMKDYEKEREDLSKDLESIREHNAKLATKLQEIEKTKADRVEEPAPDPEVDPKAYKAWAEHQIARERKRRDEELEKIRMDNMIHIERGIHEDYDDVIKLAEREMKKDAALEKKIWGAQNPAREAYRLGRKILDDKKKSEEDETKRQENIDKSDLESPTPPPPSSPKESVLTDDEKRVARKLFNDQPPEKAYEVYLAQKKAIGMA